MFDSIQQHPHCINQTTLIPRTAATRKLKANRMRFINVQMSQYDSHACSLSAVVLVTSRYVYTNSGNQPVETCPSPSLCSTCIQLRRCLRVSANFLQLHCHPSALREPNFSIRNLSASSNLFLWSASVSSWIRVSERLSQPCGLCDGGDRLQEQWPARKRKNRTSRSTSNFIWLENWKTLVHLIHPCLLSTDSFRLEASCRAHKKSEIITSRK